MRSSSPGAANTPAYTTMPTITRNSAGSSRRARRTQNALQVDARLGRAHSRDQQRGDEEAAQHEEGVDAEVAADRPRLAGVVEEHGRDREGPDAVERGLVPEVPARGTRTAGQARTRRARLPAGRCHRVA